MNNERAWYVLTPTRLRVYSARDEKDRKFDLVISKACQVVVSRMLVSYRQHAML